jgi:lysophospholipase L1-like esterase
MLHDGMELHNISHITRGAGPGVSLHRLPDAVRAGLNEVAQGVGLCPTHAEIRFVTPAPLARLTLYSGGHHEYASVFRGDHWVGEWCIEPNCELTLELAEPPAMRGWDAHPVRRFAAQVWRVRLSGTNRVHLVGLDTAGHGSRPPHASERPTRRWIAHGSSITQGFSATRLANPWVQLAAADLGYDVLNLGLGGSCHAEAAMADHIASRSDWDLCTLELGINLLSTPIGLEEFRRRVDYFIDRLTASHPAAQVVLITPFLNRQDVTGTSGPNDRHRIEEFRTVLRAAAAERSDLRNLGLVEGCAMLDRADGLSADLCHPSDTGHARMAANFARLLPRIG